MKKGWRPVSFEILRETEKALYCEVQDGLGSNTRRQVWIPKSVCTYKKIDTTDYYMNSVTEIAEWFLLKNRIRL